MTNSPLIKMKLITNFRNHSALKYNSVQYIFNIGSGLYLLTEQEVRQILPDKIQYTNIGEPYHDLVRFNYRHIVEDKWDSIDIDPKDLSNLIEMLEYINDSKIFIPNELQKYLEN